MAFKNPGLISLPLKVFVFYRLLNLIEGINYDCLNDSTSRYCRRIKVLMHEELLLVARLTEREARVVNDEGGRANK